MKVTFKSTAIASVLFSGALLANAAVASDPIRIVGSSTVYPFTTVVAEKFGKKTSHKTPIVESTGTGGGMKIFCAGGAKSPQFTNASRAIKDKELATCNKNGVTVTEFTVGIDGIVMANSNKAGELSITVPQLYQALAQKVKINGKMVANPYKKWSDIDKSLPNKKIEVMGPPPSSGTRDALVSLVMKAGAKSFGISDKKLYKPIREDGAFIEAGENDNLIVRKLTANPNAYGIFGYSFLEENRGVINAAKIGGVSPSYDTIASFEYPVARYLYLYINREKAKSNPAVKQFLAEYTSEDAIGEDGYLGDRGLIAMPDKRRSEVVNNVTTLKEKK